MKSSAARIPPICAKWPASSSIAFGGLLEAVHEAIDSGDADQVRIAAHTAKGAARNGAAPILAELMAALEQDAKAGKDRSDFIARAEAADGEFARLRRWL